MFGGCAVRLQIHQGPDSAAWIPGCDRVTRLFERDTDTTGHFITATEDLDIHIMPRANNLNPGVLLVEGTSHL